MNWKTYVYAILACIGLVGGDALLHNAGRYDSGAAASYDNTTPTDPPADSESEQYRSFTKQEFSAYAVGKTKGQIRAAFGSPTSVDDRTDTWYYGFLKIYDRDAGTQAPVDVQFEGVPDASDAVADVRFP